MSQPKLILTIPMQPLKNKLLSFVVLILSLNLAVAKNNYYQKLPDMEVLDYPFMIEISKYVAQTNHNKIYKDKPFNFKAGEFYCMEVYELTGGSILQGTNNDIQFHKTGSYWIRLIYTASFIGNNTFNMFQLNGLTFYTKYNLFPYFHSCKRHKGVCKFSYPYIPTCRFWFFEIKDGKIFNAYYYYEENDLDVLNNLVYDLINKKFFRYKELFAYHTD